MKRLATVMLALAMGCAAEAAPGEPEEGEAPTPPAAKSTWIEAATVEQSSATLQLMVPGEVEGSKEAILASAQGGFVEAANIEVGDTVAVGDPLFRIDSALYNARLAQVRAELRAAEREHKRAEKLGKIISGAERDSAKDRYDVARAAVKVAQLQAKRATIRAPFDGVIASVELEKGEVAGLGMPAARLLQLNPIKVTVSVPDRDVVGLKVGAEVEVHTDALAEPRTGRLSRINPAADIDTRAFFVEVEV
ncbi:MAG: efflux RND transporter periplasmic adaptor subunit, partial [Myxococcota bacterium]